MWLGHLMGQNFLIMFVNINYELNIRKSEVYVEYYKKGQLSSTKIFKLNLRASMKGNPYHMELPFFNF